MIGSSLVGVPYEAYVKEEEKEGVVEKVVAGLRASPVSPRKESDAGVGKFIFGACASSNSPSPACKADGDKVVEEMIAALLDEGVARRSQVCTWAAEHDKDHLLKYLVEKGYSYGATTCEAAARNGNLEMLKYLHEHKCRWNSKTTRAAAKACHFETLKFAVENGCRWNASLIDDASSAGYDSDEE